MKRKILLLPLALLGIFALVTWGCEKDDENEEVCEKYQPEQCEIANACCPTDGGNCYYEYGTSKFYCDKSKATPSDPDGCDEAETQVINLICNTAKAANMAKAKIELRALTKRLMAEARQLSVCH